eukprot:364829-Chlamydomonas_euryale.AAC.3
MQAFVPAAGTTAASMPRENYVSLPQPGTNVMPSINGHTYTLAPWGMAAGRQVQSDRAILMPSGSSVMPRNTMGGRGLYDQNVVSFQLLQLPQVDDRQLALYSAPSTSDLNAVGQPGELRQRRPRGPIPSADRGSLHHVTYGSDCRWKAQLWNKGKMCVLCCGMHTSWANTVLSGWRDRRVWIFACERGAMCGRDQRADNGVLCWISMY